MLRTTKWRPDTCGCEIEYEWDDSISDDQRVHSVKNILHPCKAHKNLDSVTHYNTILEENTEKNKLVGKVIELDDSLTHKHIEWSYDEQRKIKLSINKESSLSKSDLKKELVKITDKVEIL